jgi:acetolactate synthase-1/3 small subunit
MAHLFSCIVQNRPGVLAHVAGLFAGRGFNIDSLAVGETEDPRFSRMTIATHGDEQILEQIRKQLSKVIDVVRVYDLGDVRRVERDLVLAKVNAPPSRRPELLQIADLFRSRVVDVGAKEVILELSGTEEKIEAFVDLLGPFGIKELARTGRIAMARGPRPAGLRRAEAASPAATGAPAAQAGEKPKRA